MRRRAARRSFSRAGPRRPGASSARPGARASSRAGTAPRRSRHADRVHEARRDLRVPRGDVVRPVRIRVQVVERDLGERRSRGRPIHGFRLQRVPHETPRSLAHREDAAVGELGDLGPRGELALHVGIRHREQRSAARGRQRRQVHPLEQRRRDVGEPDRVVEDALAGQRIGMPQDERHVERGVRQRAVRADHPVLQELHPVQPGQHEHGARPRLRRLRGRGVEVVGLVEPGPDQGALVRDLSVVERAQRLAVGRRGRVLAAVHAADRVHRPVERPRVRRVDEHAAGEDRVRLRHGFARRPGRREAREVDPHERPLAHAGIAREPARARAQRVEVRRERLDVLDPARERLVRGPRPGEEGRGRETSGAEGLAQRDQFAREEVAGLRDAVLEGRARAEQRRERHVAHRRRREAAREHDAVRGDVVEPERALFLAHQLVARHPRGRPVVHEERAAIGAQVLDRHEEDVSRLEPRPLAPARDREDAGGDDRDGTEGRARQAVSSRTHAR